MSRSRSPRPLLAAAGALVLVLAIAGPVAAKEITSGGGGGGGGGGTTTCQPVTSLTAKGDARVGELGFADISGSWNVKSCTGAPVIVNIEAHEYLNPAVVVWENPRAVLSGKYTINGVKVRTTYLVTVTVKDAATGELQGSLSVAAAAIPKGV